MEGTTRLWLWITFIGMTIGAVIFGSKAASMRKKEGMFDPRKASLLPLWRRQYTGQWLWHNGKTSEWTRSFQKDVT